MLPALSAVPFVWLNEQLAPTDLVSLALHSKWGSADSAPAVGSGGGSGGSGAPGSSTPSRPRRRRSPRGGGGGAAGAQVRQRRDSGDEPYSSAAGDDESVSHGQDRAGLDGTSMDRV